MVSVFHVHQAHCGLKAIVSVVSGVALHEVGRCRLETVGVEQPRDAGRDHAAPVVVVHIEHAGDHRELHVRCGFKRGKRETKQTNAETGRKDAKPSENSQK